MIKRVPKALLSLASACLGLFIPALGVADPAFLTPVVVDSNGKVLGPLVDSYSVALTLHPGDPPVRFWVDRTGFSYKPNGIQLYTTEDCSGTVYIPVDTEPRIAYRTRLKDLSRSVSAVAGLNPTVIQARDAKYTERPGWCLTPGPPETVLAAPRIVVDLDKLGFKPPFKVELR